MTKFAVISDIHSNVWALEAVLEDAGKKGVDGLINLGDILYGPLAPGLTFDLLQSQEIITIKGNQDRQIYEAGQREIAENPTMQVIFSELEDKALSWLRELPASLSLENTIFLCHGSPDDDMAYMLEDVSSGSPVVKSDSEISACLSGIQERLILCGHTHIPRTIQLKNGKLVVNPGSVGLPAYSDSQPVPHKMENFSHHACYCTVEEVASGWMVEHINVPYKVEFAIEAARHRSCTDWALLLETGRV